MDQASNPEVWLRGPVQGINPSLQPVAHALLQAREELNGLMKDFNDELLWQKPAGVASPGFHLQHLSGVLDRLFTYARGEMLSQTQLAALELENEIVAGANTAILVERFNRQVDQALSQIRETDEVALTHIRGVGRAKLPSTVLGLLVHSAEHTMRHLGQLLVTVRVLQGRRS